MSNSLLDDKIILIEFVKKCIDNPQQSNYNLANLYYCLKNYSKDMDYYRVPIIRYLTEYDNIERYEKYLMGKFLPRNEKYYLLLEFKWYIEYVSLLVGSGTTLTGSYNKEQISNYCNSYLRNIRLERLGI